jgi:hypothetical protein
MSDGIITASVGSLLLGSILLNQLINGNKEEKYGNVAGLGAGYPGTRQFYGRANAQQNIAQKYGGPNFALPSGDQNVSLNGGSQLLSYQIYQQATNAATPTIDQLNSISGQSQQQTGAAAMDLGGGLSSDLAPYNILGNSGPTLYNSEFQAVNFGSDRANTVSACSQNTPTSIATSLLPKPVIPGQESWQIGAPNNILANQSFLSGTQQIGVDTVMGSKRNQSYDIRDNIPNQIDVVSPWNNTTLLPDLQKRPLSCFVSPGQGIYGCGGPSVGANVNGTFVGR